MDRRLQSYPQVLQDATLPLRRVMLRRSLQYCHGIPAFFVPQIHGAQTILRIVEMLRVTFWSFYYGTGMLQRFSYMIKMTRFLFFFDFEDVPVSGFEAGHHHQSASKCQLQNGVRSYRGGARRGGGESCPPEQERR